jgi:prepilin-type N-terminal cleavage/methylation domain-containing protein
MKMIQKLMEPRAHAQSGYSLVELSLVLVVIGLILGAVSVGKDMQRNAEYKKVKQKFVDQWVGAYDQHFDRLGIVVGDAGDFPLGVVGSEAITNAGDRQDLEEGDFDLVAQANVPALCRTGAGGVDDLREYFDDAGIELPPGRGANLEDTYLYLDSNGNPQQLQVCFRWLVPGSDISTGNTLLISGLTPDLAKALDAAIDGRADGTDGRFRRSLEAITSDDISNAAVNTAADWPAGNDVNDVTATALDGNDQVQTVVAAYKMVQ